MDNAERQVLFLHSCLIREWLTGSEKLTRATQLLIMKRKKLKRKYLFRLHWLIHFMEIIK
ncbi:MAG: hypothetical protein C5S38_00755 [Candidatus Methanophagaceae archaeon]|nr:MAG: hypothetical protein C5S38_00755 [Methanophagales archaeon]